MAVHPPGAVWLGVPVLGLGASPSPHCGSHPHPLFPLVWGRSLLIGGLLHFLLALPAVPCPSLPSVSSLRTSGLPPCSVQGLHGLGRPGPSFPCSPWQAQSEESSAETEQLPPCPGITGSAGAERRRTSLETLPGGNREVQSPPAAPMGCSGRASHRDTWVPCNTHLLWVAPAGRGAGGADMRLHRCPVL